MYLIPKSKFVILIRFIIIGIVIAIFYFLNMRSPKNMAPDVGSIGAFVPSGENFLIQFAESKERDADAWFWSNNYELAVIAYWSASRLYEDINKKSWRHLNSDSHFVDAAYASGVYNESSTATERLRAKLALTNACIELGEFAK